MSYLIHEQLYRSQALMDKLKTYTITICGSGALGANLTENLARAGCGNLKVIDFDRIEERNLSTQPYYKTDIGGFKAKVLSNSLYRAIGAKIRTETKELTADNVGTLLQGTDLVIDAFDNSRSRQIITDHCITQNQPCLHTGLTADYAEIIWNEDYRVPSDINDDICDYPLARNLVMLTVAVASELITQHIATGAKPNRTITLKDLSIQTF